MRTYKHLHYPAVTPTLIVWVSKNKEIQLNFKMFDSLHHFLFAKFIA